MVCYRRLALTLVVLSLLLAGCGASPTEAPMPTETPVPSPPPSPTLAAPPSASLPGSGAPSLPERVEAALSDVQRLEGTTLATVDGEEITCKEYEPTLRQALLVLNQQHEIDWEDSAMQERLKGVQNYVSTNGGPLSSARIATEQGVTVSDEQMKAQIEHEMQILNSGQYTDWDAFLEKNGLTQNSFEQVIDETLLFNALLTELEVDDQGEQIHIAHIVVNDQSPPRRFLTSRRPGRFRCAGRPILNRRTNQGQQWRSRLVHPGNHGSSYWPGRFFYRTGTVQQSRSDRAWLFDHHGPGTRHPRSDRASAPEAARGPHHPAGATRAEAVVEYLVDFAETE